jgi:hypothetical protein
MRNGQPVADDDGTDGEDTASAESRRPKSA